jgi:8-oxo-dGTP pyrophosphatase MutT (NUDIX family)
MKDSIPYGPCGEERVVYEGKHFEVVRQPYRIGKNVVEFERVQRSPGTRLIVVRDRQLLLTKEFRAEFNDYDYRLPGGKVFDSLEEYQDARKKGRDILQSAERAARKECEEECGLVPKKLTHYAISAGGSMVTWDLYYFIVADFAQHPKGQQLKDGEAIEPVWFSFEDVKRLCIEGKIQEDRTVGVLLRFLLSQG